MPANVRQSLRKVQSTYSEVSKIITMSNTTEYTKQEARSCYNHKQREKDLTFLMSFPLAAKSARSPHQHKWTAHDSLHFWRPLVLSPSPLLRLPLCLVERCSSWLRTQPQPKGASAVAKILLNSSIAQSRNPTVVYNNKQTSLII
jgi:hypothetical protein